MFVHSTDVRIARDLTIVETNKTATRVEYITLLLLLFPATYFIHVASRCLIIFTSIQYASELLEYSACATLALVVSAMISARIRAAFAFFKETTCSRA